MTARLKTAAQPEKKVLGPCTGPCPIERGMRILGGKWTGSILWHLKDEPVRFNELARMIDGASKKMIADRLRQLDDLGLIKRRVIETSPIAVEYQITKFGLSALECLDSLRQWSESLPPSVVKRVGVES